MYIEHFSLDTYIYIYYIRLCMFTSKTSLVHETRKYEIYSQAESKYFQE